MAVNLEWFKDTGLAAAQSAAHAFLGVSGGDVFNLLHIDWKGALGISGGAAMAAVLHAVIAYKRKGGPEVIGGTTAPEPAAVAPAVAAPAEKPAADAAPTT